MTDRAPALERPYVATAGAEDGGPILVCLHGIGSSSASFAPQMQTDGLARLGRVLAWDAPGYGRSADPPAGTTGANVADAVADLVAELGRPVVLWGMSWGGVIALLVALRHPGLVSGLVLGDSTPGSGTSVAKAAAMRARVPELVELGERAFAHARARRLLRSNAPEVEVQGAIDVMVAGIRPSGYAVAAESMAATDLRPELGQIDVPTLIFYGEEDRVTGRPASEALARGIRGAHLFVVPRAGHLANQENPVFVNRLVTTFLSDLNTSGETHD